MSYISRANVARLSAERPDTKWNVKWGGFRSQLQVSYASSHSKELIQRNSLSVNDYIYIYIYIYLRGAFNKFPEFFCIGS